MNTRGSHPKVWLISGILLFLFGVLSNEWTLARILTVDGGISHPLLRVLIWIANGFCVIAGLRLIRNRSRILLPPRVIPFTLTSWLLLLLILEAGAQVYVFLILRRHPSRTEYLWPEMGWHQPQNHFLSATRQPDGTQAHATTTRYGFRLFGDVNTKKIKLLVLGDSYTLAQGVPDGTTYYDYLAQNQDRFEVFAYGCGGYGSLQEYLILDRMYDVIKPDVILWQFCENDLEDNILELDSAIVRFSMEAKRPYLIDGKIQLKNIRIDNPLFHLGRYSLLLRKIIKQLYILEWQADKNYGISESLWAQSINTTSEVMALVRHKVSDKPVFSFLACDPNIPDLARYESAFQNISLQNGIQYIPLVLQRISDALRADIPITASSTDGHWNSLGHSIAGKAILETLEKLP